MIVCQLQGGLGNQMFQYAAARALAEARATQVVLDLTWLKHQHGADVTPREFELNSFVLSQTTKQLSGSLLDRLRMKFVTHYQEPHFHFDAKLLQQSNNTQLKGYFQSERYFKSIRSTLLKDFSWAAPPTGKNNSLLKKINNDPNSVSLHVRRGDYVTNAQAAKMHGLLTTEYYKRAVVLCAKQIKIPTLYVISDDPTWCKQNLSFIYPTTYISHNQDGSEDMRLMKACRHNIIANSSFSWWGAWLNENPQKIVVAPKRWFAHPGSSTKDVVPKTWQQV